MGLNIYFRRDDLFQSGILSLAASGTASTACASDVAFVDNGCQEPSYVGKYSCSGLVRIFTLYLSRCLSCHSKFDCRILPALFGIWLIAIIVW